MGATRTDVGAVILIGGLPSMWDVFTGAPEFRDGGPDPLDRWSKRVLGAVASPLGARCAFPSDGPPYPPFISWALASGRFHHSPVGMMVHDTAGLMISLRGALILDHDLPLPDAARPSPCDSCPDQPCRVACPVDALGGESGYDVPVCKGFLRAPAGADCMAQGCAARRACPVSQAHGRLPDQSAFHMRAFLKNDP